MNIIERLKKSKSLLAQSIANDYETFKNLKHNKNDLEFLLGFCIVELQFSTKSGVKRQLFCTGNIPFINLFSQKEQAKQHSIIKLNTTILRSRKKNYIKTWDLIESKYKTIELIDWTITNFIQISEKNTLVLNALIKKFLKKNKNDQLRISPISK